jgi:hypothetical protein
MLVNGFVMGFGQEHGHGVLRSTVP